MKYLSNIAIKIIIILIILLLIYFSIIIKLRNKYFKKIIKPKISIFLPIYNQEKYLYRSIGSIQKQTLKEIEIISVNDCSKDNSLDILLKISKNDTRIKIVNNSKNMGLLYSRAMGIINSKGEYLMNLDPDDELKGSYILEFLYKIVNKTKIDVLNFGLVKKYKFHTKKFNFYTNFNKIKYQPEIFHTGSLLGDYLITNKLIKKELFIKVFNLFKKKIYGDKWNYAEDEIWSSFILKNAKSMICINKIVFIYYKNTNSLMKNRFNIIYIKNLIYWIEMFKIIYDKNNYKNFLFYRFSNLTNIISNKILLNLIKNDKEIKTKYINIFKNFAINYNFSNNYLNIIKF